MADDECSAKVLMKPCSANKIKVVAAASNHSYVKVTLAIVAVSLMARTQ